MTIEYKLVKTIEGKNVKKEKIKLGFFLIGRIHQDFYGMTWRCLKCKELCAFPKFTIGEFLSEKIEPSFSCAKCNTVKNFDKDEFKNVLYRIWVDDRLFEKNVIYICADNNKEDENGKQTTKTGKESI